MVYYLTLITPSGCHPSKVQGEIYITLFASCSICYLLSDSSHSVFWHWHISHSGSAYIHLNLYILYIYPRTLNIANPCELLVMQDLPISVVYSCMLHKLIHPDSNFCLWCVALRHSHLWGMSRQYFWWPLESHWLKAHCCSLPCYTKEPFVRKCTLKWLDIIGSLR